MTADHDHTHEHHDHDHEHHHHDDHDHEHHHHDHDHGHHHDHEHGHDHDHSDEHHHHHQASHEGHEGLGDDEHMLVHFREAKDAFMQGHPQSPLPESERAHFTGLSYYPYNPDLHFVVQLDRAVSSDPITMQTSTGEERELHRAGKARFEVGGQPAELTVYRSGDEDDLFLPLRDATSGNETYGAGRYLDLEEEEDGTIDLDFNYLYNPSCAYNEAYSCPLPPMENWLRVPLQAGEKTYAHADH